MTTTKKRGKTIPFKTHRPPPRIFLTTVNRASAAAAPISPRASGEAFSYRCESEGAWLPEPGAATSWRGEERRALLRPPEKRRTGAGGSCSMAASCAWLCLFLPNRARVTTTGVAAALLVRRAGASEGSPERRRRERAAAGIAENLTGTTFETSERVEEEKMKKECAIDGFLSFFLFLFRFCLFVLCSLFFLHEPWTRPMTPSCSAQVSRSASFRDC